MHAEEQTISTLGTSAWARRFPPNEHGAKLRGLLRFQQLPYRFLVPVAYSFLARKPDSVSCDSDSSFATHAVRDRLSTICIRGGSRQDGLGIRSFSTQRN